MKLPIPAQIPAAEALGRVHFVGIGGAGLSGMAQVMAARGIDVSGCDGQESATLARLREAGIECHVGHDPAHLSDVDTLVVSTAIAEGTTEVTEALAAGKTVLPRSAAMQSLLAGHQVLAVAGTHGKTTTSSMLAVALREVGADPSFLIGGQVPQLGSNAWHGADDLFVAEADESDGAFLVYTPHAALVTNVEADHLDIWGSAEAYEEAFGEFLDRVEPGGFVVVGADDPGAARLAQRARERGLTTITTGEAKRVDLRLKSAAVTAVGSTARVTWRGSDLGSLELAVIGRHYLKDAAVALAAGLHLGLPADRLLRGLAAYTGTERRMELKGEAGGVRVYDSYAHHPAEIAGDLESARALVGEGRLVAVFQPHLVSRTRIFGVEMGQALAAADIALVLDVYLAREEADPKVTGQLVADAVPLGEGKVEYVADLDTAAEVAIRRARPGDLVITLGAGDVTSLGPVILAGLADD